MFPIITRTQKLNHSIRKQDSYLAQFLKLKFLDALIYKEFRDLRYPLINIFIFCLPKAKDDFVSQNIPPLLPQKHHAHLTPNLPPLLSALLK